MGKTLVKHFEDGINYLSAEDQLNGYCCNADMTVRQIQVIPIPDSNKVAIYAVLERVNYND